MSAHGAQALLEIVLQGEHWAENLFHYFTESGEAKVRESRGRWVLSNYDKKEAEVTELVAEDIGEKIKKGARRGGRQMSEFESSCA